MKQGVDLLVCDCAEVVTLGGGEAALSVGPSTGAAMDDPGVVRGGAVAVREGLVVAVDREQDLLARYDAPKTLSAMGGTVVPGFCDAHTHPVFDATREAEFDMRARGKTYVEITAAGGGIFSSVRSLREAPRERLAELLRARLDGMLASGTTSIEAKSGYGLTLETEVLALELLADAHTSHPVDIDPTCLAAHQVPPEFRDDREGYIRLVCEQILPEVARSGLARSADVFCDLGAYTVDEARAILVGAKAVGLALRVHADELDAVGAAELAAEMGAQTADHLVRISDDGIEAMAAAGTAPVLLPGTCFSLRSREVPPARRMIEAGLPLVIASDFNPGTSYISSMVTIVGLACGLLGLTVAEALCAATRNAAETMGLPGMRGRLVEGAVADLVLLDVPDHLYLGYEFGRNPVRAVVKDGRVIHRRGEPERFDRSER
jgi:imidazolonepropionase